MSTAGRPVPPGTSSYDWVGSVVSAVEQRIGRPSRWNGRLYEELSPDCAGSARADGSMTLSPAKVLTPALRAYDRRQLSQLELREARDAVLTVTHDAAHLCCRPGDPAAAGAQPVNDDAELALNEGLTESWTHLNADNVMYDIGLDRVAPGVLDQRNVDAYPLYRGATNELAKHLGETTGLRQTEVLRRLQTADRSQRWNVAADLLIDAKRLGRLMPAADRPAVRAELVRVLRPVFASLPQIHRQGQYSSLQLGRRAGRRAFTGMDDLATQFKSHFRSQQAGAARQPGAVGKAAEAEVGQLQRLMSGQGPATAAVNTAPQPDRPTRGPAITRGPDRGGPARE